jgi:hypothetical protein
MTGTTPSMIAVEEVIADIKAGPAGQDRRVLRL